MCSATRGPSALLCRPAPQGAPQERSKYQARGCPHAQGYRLRAEVAVSEPGGRGRTRSRVRTRRDRSLEPAPSDGFARVGIRQLAGASQPTRRRAVTKGRRPSNRDPMIYDNASYNLVGSKGQDLARLVRHALNRGNVLEGPLRDRIADGGNPGCQGQVSTHLGRSPQSSRRQLRVEMG